MVLPQGAKQYQNRKIIIANYFKLIFKLDAIYESYKFWIHICDFFYCKTVHCREFGKYRKIKKIKIICKLTS